MEYLHVAGVLVLSPANENARCQKGSVSELSRDWPITATCAADYN